jgi:hypothetical protein
MVETADKEGSVEHQVQVNRQVPLRLLELEVTADQELQLMVAD